MSSTFVARLRNDIPVIDESQIHHQQQHHQQQQQQQQQHSLSFTLPSHTLQNINQSRFPHNARFLAPVPLETDIARLSHSPVSTTESSPATTILEYDHSPDYYVQRTSQAVQQSIPAARHSSLEALGLPQFAWEQQSNNNFGRQQIRHSIPPSLYHRRTNSDSTVPALQYPPTSYPQQILHQPQIVDPEAHRFSPYQEVYDHQIPAIPKSYPQTSLPAGYPAFSVPDYQLSYSHAPSQQQLQWNAMSQTILSQQVSPHFQRQLTHEMDQQEDINGASEDNLQLLPVAKVPGLPRTISAICEDELYNVAEPSVRAQISIPPPTRVNGETRVHSPSNTVFSQRLHAASQSHLEAARSASPTTTAFSGERSPFRTSSVMSGTAYDSPSSPGPRMNTFSQLREQQRNNDVALAISKAARRSSRESSQTVSPKEVSLEYEPPVESESQAVMFNNLPNSPRHPPNKGRPSRLNQELTRGSTYESVSNGEESPNAPNMASVSQPTQVPQQYPFIRAHPSTGFALPESSQESNPRFAPTLISMESTRSGSRSSAPASPEILMPQKEETPEEDEAEEEVEDEEDEASEAENGDKKLTPQRPGNTRTDGGTYTCTYHGCTQRFETPQKLQRHKKEGHRQGTPSSNVDSRLTQAGPHKCERINPQTGKPCNSIFSRPYDLTRHEDTIHNAKKQKVRCKYCTEEKTFSRNDALTRHMRVVHPDIEFSGKSKRGSR